LVAFIAGFVGGAGIAGIGRIVRADGGGRKNGRNRCRQGGRSREVEMARGHE
jgi:hypothetical protein